MDFAKIGAMADAANAIPVEIQKGFASILAQQQTVIELLRLNAYLLAAIWANQEPASAVQEEVAIDAILEEGKKYAARS